MGPLAARSVRGDPAAARLDRARSRRTWSSSARRCAGPPASSASTSAGHGGSDDAPTTFGLHEIDDVAGALAWLGERGSGASRSSARRWAASSRSPRSSCWATGRSSRPSSIPTAPAAAVERAAAADRGDRRGVGRAGPPDPDRQPDAAADRRRPAPGVRRPDVHAWPAAASAATCGRPSPAGSSVWSSPSRSCWSMAGPIGRCRPRRRSAARRPGRCRRPSTGRCQALSTAKHAGRPRRNGTNGSPGSSVWRFSGSREVVPIIHASADADDRSRFRETGRRLMAAKILVVDDDPNVQRLLQYTLKQEGYEVVIAHGRRRGLPPVGSRGAGPDPPRRHAAQARRVPGGDEDPDGGGHDRATSRSSC